VRAARIEHDAGDVRALREALGIERWDVLGHSWGGGIAMLGVAADQGGTRRLVLVDPVGVTSHWLRELHDGALARLSSAERAQLAAAADAMAASPDLAQYAERYADYSQAMYRAWFADAELAAVFAPPRAASHTGAAVAGRLRREGYDWRPALADLNVPTLVIHGERDLIPVDVPRATAALLPQARLALLPDAGHLPFWEAPEQFFTLVEQFLAE
jgi:proline iminopeptidase